MQELLEKVISLVKEVGEFQMKHFRSERTGFGEEKIEKEFVSFVDIESERMLRSSLLSFLPESGFYGEETKADRKPTEWIVDPIDGTTNYLSGLAQFSISVALYKNGKPDLGVVYQPATGDIFSAIKGKGLHHNGKPCPKVSPDITIENALIGTGFPYRSKDMQKNFFACAEQILNKSRGIRRMGSAALDLAYLAAGYIQGFWESDLQLYDVAAALLFLNEAGVTCTALNNKVYNAENNRILIAGFPSIHAELSKCVTFFYT